MRTKVLNKVGDDVDLPFVKSYGNYSRVGLRGVVRYPVLYRISPLVFAWEVDSCWDTGYYGHEFEYKYLQELFLRKTPSYNYRIFMFRKESEKW